MGACHLSYQVRSLVSQLTDKYLEVFHGLSGGGKPSHGGELRYGVLVTAGRHHRLRWGGDRPVNGQHVGRCKLPGVGVQLKKFASPFAWT